jgi:quercetin dioxygenase-like cupin family protein
MRSFRLPRQPFVLLAMSVTATLIAIAAYAALPSRTVLPGNVGLGTLAGKTPVNVLSVDAFTRAINQAHGTNAVLQHVHFGPNQSTLWHTHPGPNVVLVVDGSATLTDERCQETTYHDGQGFATGLKKHLFVAGPGGVDLYAVYLLPADADVLRTPPAGESLDPPNCGRRKDDN